MDVIEAEAEILPLGEAGHRRAEFARLLAARVCSARDPRAARHAALARP